MENVHLAPQWQARLATFVRTMADNQAAVGPGRAVPSIDIATKTQRAHPEFRLFVLSSAAQPVLPALSSRCIKWVAEAADTLPYACPRGAFARSPLVVEVMNAVLTCGP